MKITHQFFNRVLSAVLTYRNEEWHRDLDLDLVDFLYALGGKLICLNQPIGGGEYLTKVEYAGIMFQHVGPNQISLPKETLADEDRRQDEESRRGEIALLLVKYRIFKQGIPGDGFQRDLGNMAKEIGISREEMQSFYESLLPEIIGKLLGKKKVDITTSD